MSDAATNVRVGRVVHLVDAEYRASRVVIDQGARDGIKMGDRFLVYGVGPEISDPDSGESLGRVEIVRGQGEVTHLQDRLATITSIERRRTVRAVPSVFGTFPTMHDKSGEEYLPFLAVQVGDLAKAI